MYKLEHLKQDEQKSMKVAPTLLEIQKKQELMKDDLKLHGFMMKTFREDEKRREAKTEKDDSILKRGSLSIKLLEENEEDAKLAKLYTKMPETSTAAQSKEELMKSVANQSIFKSSNKNP